MDTDLNQSDPRYFNEGSIPLMKLFVKGEKTSPRRFEGGRNVQGFLGFISEHCGDVAKGAGLIKAQWGAYARKHLLAERLEQMCLWFEAALAKAARPQAKDMQINPERWLALYFQARSLPAASDSLPIAFWPPPDCLLIAY